MKHFIIRALAFASCLLNVPAQGIAQTERVLIDDCFKALSAGDERAINETAASVMDIGYLPALKDRIDAGICLTEATGRRWQYYPKLKKMVPSNIVAKITDMSAAPGEAAQAYKARNSSLIAQEIFSFCYELYETKPVMAMTNHNCVEVFLDKGHPKMQSKEEFVRDFISQKFDDLNEEEIYFVLEMFPATALEQ